MRLWVLIRYGGRDLSRQTRRVQQTALRRLPDQSPNNHHPSAAPARNSRDPNAITKKEPHLEPLLLLLLLLLCCWGCCSLVSLLVGLY